MALNQANILSLTSMKKSTVSKLVLGVAALMMLTVIGSAGIANAAPTEKPSKQDCISAGFTDYGQCVKEWAQDKNNGNHGYGGTNNAVHTNINNNQGGHDNVFSVIINYFFG